MTLNDELTAVQQSLDGLLRSLDRLERRPAGEGLELRRVRTDAGHLRESIALLREALPQDRPRPAMVPVPDTPYDAALWAGAEDEGLGACDRRAP